MRLYVGNISYDATEDSLRSMFEEFGPVESVNIITDRETGRSRGFGFVDLPDEAAEKAMKELDGKSVDGRSLKVNEAKERRPRRSGPYR